MEAIEEKEITFESHPVSYIHCLEQELENARPDRLSAEDIENVSDNYQANLEYQWYKDEQMEIIKGYISKLTPEQLELYKSS